MKTYKCLLVALVILCSLQASAEELKGYIVLKTNEKINVTLIIPFKLLSSEPDYESFQYKVKYLAANNKTVVAKADDTKEISFEHKGKQVRMLSVLNNFDQFSSSQSNIFLKLEVDGKLKLFKHYSTDKNPASFGKDVKVRVENFLLQKGDGPLYKPGDLSFKKDMAKYLSDCESVSSKIEGKEFKKDDLGLIVAEYNSNCSN